MKYRRIFIVSDKQFPHGDAGGNRIEYMAKSFASEGIQPFVISLGKNTETEYNSNTGYYSYQEIIYKNANVSKDFFSWYIFSGFKVKNILASFYPNYDDPIVIYSTNPIFISIIKKKFGKKHRVFYDVVEWDDYNSFKYGRIDPHYLMFRWAFYGIFPSGEGVIAISKSIENYFKAKGCKTYLYPICLDSNTLYRNYHFRDAKILNLIYPGNPENKDDIAKVIKAISSLRKEEQEKIRLHFTAVSKVRIESLIGEDKYLLEILSDYIIFHPWLEYEELIKLYYSMDALILFRFDNQVSRSNFPSKVPELLSCGVFIIANNIGDFSEYIEDGIDSIKISGNTIEACASALQRAITLNSAERASLSSNAQISAKNKFNYKLFSKRISQFIQ